MNGALVIIPLLIAVFFIVVGVFQLLWNSTFPGLFGWKTISLWTAFKIILIASILSGGAMRIPLGYGESSTTAGPNGNSTTTTWSVGSQSK